MDLHSEWIYKLLHERRTRQAFVRKDLDAIGMPEQIRADFLTIDVADLERSAQKVILQLHSIIRDAHPGVLKRWAELFPEDPHGFELIFLYAASEFYREAHNIAFTENDISLPFAFPAFVKELIDVSPEKLGSLLQ